MAKSKQPPAKALSENPAQLSAARALRQGNSPAATSAAKLLGSRGGKARVARQSAAERSASARNAAQVRWQNAHQREASRG